jgi:prepilin-type N-terminal cleavage/methylation domain-containing protein
LNSPVPVQRTARAFTLLELLVVIGIIAIIFAFLGPAINPLKSAGDVTTAAYMITSFFEHARSYAVSNNTYVWVGVYEEDAAATKPTNAQPPYPGRGRLLLAAVAARDGTTSCEDPTSTSSTRIPLNPALVTQVGKLVRIDNVHMADVGPPAPSSAPSPTPSPDSLDGRSSLPYTYGRPNDYLNRISSDDTHAPNNATLYPFVAQGYTFYKTVRFSPIGEANINSTYTTKRVAEIGLLPTRGSSVDVSNRNTVAIQFSGIAGNFKVYRR